MEARGEPAPGKVFAPFLLSICAFQSTERIETEKKNFGMPRRLGVPCGMPLIECHVEGSSMLQAPYCLVGMVARNHRQLASVGYI